MEVVLDKTAAVVQTAEFSDRKLEMEWTVVAHTLLSC
jgi:hypothetical protein